MAFKLGDSDINKIYKGTFEIRKAYLGGLLVFDNTAPQTEYYLGLNSVNQDFLFIPQDEKTYNVPSTGVFEFGCRLRIPSSNPNENKGIIGYNYQSGLNSRWGVFMNLSGQIRLNFWSGSSTDFYDVVSNYGGQVVDMRAGFYDESPFARIYINDVLVSSSEDTSRPDNVYPDGFNFTIGCRTESGTNNPIQFYGEPIYSFFIDNDVFECNEGSGFPTISNTGITATGSTSNAGGLTYWNANVWTEYAEEV